MKSIIMDWSCELTSLVVKCDQGSNAGLLALQNAASSNPGQNQDAYI